MIFICYDNLFYFILLPDQLLVVKRLFRFTGQYGDVSGK